MPNATVSRPWKLSWRPLAALAAAFLLAAAAEGAHLYRACAAMEDGRSSLEAASGRLLVDDALDLPPSELDRLAAELAAAEAAFAEAAAILDGDPLFGLAGRIPWLAQQAGAIPG